jgi:hypothetical protein
MAPARDRDFTPDQMAQMFLAFGNGMLRALLAGGKAAVTVMAAHAVERELSFPKTGPPVFPGLRWQSGHLRRTVAASPYAEAKSEKEGEAGFGTSSPYGIKHEAGYEGTEQVPQHVRRVKTRDVSVRVDGKRRRVATGVAFVRAHERYVSYRARKYLARTLEHDSPVADRLIDRSLWMLVTTGEPPTPNEVLQGGVGQ